MIKVVALLFRNPALSREQFRKYWEETHVPLVRAAMPGLVRYAGSFPILDDGADRAGSALECDAVIELGWPDRATMERDMASPEFNTPERQASSEKLMDLSRTQTVLTEEVLVDCG